MGDWDWVTISALATAAGTFVLALATFASVRSANRAARVAEISLLAGLRPLLMPSRRNDLEQKIGFYDSHWVVVGGGYGSAEATDDSVYLSISVRNAGAGIAVLDAWHFYPERVLSTDEGRSPDPDEFSHLNRDLYIPANDVGFWQGTFREPDSAEFKEAHARITAREPVTVDVLYGDYEGGQRSISRFTLTPTSDGTRWLASVSRHWNLDRDEPRAH